ncbi:MAG: nitroreductase family protein [Acetilactobacillus jinshanensis]
MKTGLLKLEKMRRSIYALGKDVKQTPDELADFIKQTVKWTPSPFNNQTTRVVMLFGKSHDKLWDIVGKALAAKIGKERYEKGTAKKIAGFKEAFATVLYFTDTDVVKKFEKDFPTYAANFPDWSEQAQGNAQYAVWTGLAENGIGANLQHYNPLIDAQVAKVFNVPKNWKLRAEMDFGSVKAPAGKKSFMPDDQRFKVFK